MVSFAVGGILGDTLFHLLPEIFLGEDSPEHVRFVMIEPNKNLLLGVAIMVGFITFVAMDKGLRIATGGDGGHGHHHSHAMEEPKAVASGIDSSTPDGKARMRKKGGEQSNAIADSKTEDINASVKLGGYLNLM